MGKFNRTNKFGGGNDYKQRDFRGRGEGTFMHKAVCSRCGKECELPFKPNGRKPVFCNDCFQKNRGGEFKRFDDRRPGRFSSDRFQPERREERFEHPAPRNSDTFQYKEQFNAINAKLDKIIRMMAPPPPPVKAPETEPVIQMIEQAIGDTAEPVQKKRKSKKKLSETEE